MRFVYGRQDMPTLARAQENCYLITNGLGGYSSLSAAFSMSRGDQGLLVSARTAPNDRVTMLARMQEELLVGGERLWLSSQQFADDTPDEDGWKRLSSFVMEDAPMWVYDVRGVQVKREVFMDWGNNVLAVRYRVDNRTAESCRLTARPQVLGFEKGHAPLKAWDVSFEDGCIRLNGMKLYVRANGRITAEKPSFSLQHYMHDAPDGRPEKGLVAGVCAITWKVYPQETAEVWAVFSAEWQSDKTPGLLWAGTVSRMEDLRRTSRLQDPVAQQLAQAADAYIALRSSTLEKTILAGYPFFGDWGRDTMIALPGCCLSTRRYEDAKSILHTFLAYERDGLVPNLFPEGDQEPMYNTADAALLLINTVYLYARRTEDLDFAREAWPVMKRIVAAYRRGTRHGIRMDADGLICAGEGLDQVTWMDVRVGEILPTPRHGKPVEINAYWYSALMIMAALASAFGEDSDYLALAEKVKRSFLRAFWREDAGCLRDVISGTAADGQIRCNQIWAVTQPFTMLSPEQERAVVDTVYAHLYTPSGLRTLSPEDPQYHAVYEGVQKERDMAYHQGTAWVFPLGAYYLAYLKTRGFSREAARQVREALAPVASALREGCAGQLPEIYDGGMPAFSRGCFAQAWSVGEMLRVYEKLEEIEAGVKETIERKERSLWTLTGDESWL